MIKKLNKFHVHFFRVLEFQLIDEFFMVFNVKVITVRALLMRQIILHILCTYIKL